jgi:hypothetical protein
MNPLLAVILLLLLLAAVFVGYEYYLHRSPSSPAISPATVTWELR